MKYAYYNENDSKAAAWLKELIKRNLIAPGEVDDRSILDVQPSDLRGFAQCHFFAGIGVWSYALREAGWPDDRPVWTGSCPCFTAGHLVWTRKGSVPIELIRAGDEVLTHKGRFRKVLRAGSEIKEVGVLKGQGHFGIECTPGHPFLTAKREIQSTRRRGKNANIHHLSSPFWTKAEDSVGRWWCSPSSYPEQKANLPKGFSASDLLWLAGAYVGDGWTSGKSLVFGLSESKLGGVVEALERLGLKLSIQKEKTCFKVRTHATELAEWMELNFKKGAHLKSLPPWLLSHQLRREFLNGWHYTDGTRKPSGGALRITTVSRKLAVEGCMLATSLGFSTQFKKVKTPKATYIEGREVSQSDYYVIAYSESERYRFQIENHSFQKIKSFTKAGHERVYNIEVEGDHSYILDGIIVHNCQPFSTAGKRGGTADGRHLFPAWFWLIQRCRPQHIFGEQVAQKAGDAWFDSVSNALGAEGYTTGQVVSPCCCFGAPHLRKRRYWAAVDGLAHSGSPRLSGWEEQPARQERQAFERGGDAGRLANVREAGLSQRSEHHLREAQPGADAGGCCGSGGVADDPGERRERRRASEEGDEPEAQQRPEQLCDASGLGNSDCGGREQSRLHASGDREEGRERSEAESCDAGAPIRPGPTNGFWRDADWLGCRDGKWRPVESMHVKLVDGPASSVVSCVHKGAKEIDELQALPEGVNAKEVFKRGSREPKYAEEKKVLRSKMHGEGAREGEVQQPESQPEEISSLNQGDVRNLRKGGAACPSQGRGPEKQQPLQLEDVVLLLSPSISLAQLHGRREDEEALSLLREVIHQSANVPHSSLSPAEVWASLSEEEKDRIRVGFDASRWELVAPFPLRKKAPARVAALKGFGNAIVAPQAIEFVKAYMEIA